MERKHKPNKNMDIQMMNRIHDPDHIDWDLRHVPTPPEIVYP